MFRTGCCFSCDVVCEPEPEPDQPPTISSSIYCSQPGNNGWCIGPEVLTLAASDPQNYILTITGDIGGMPPGRRSTGGSMNAVLSRTEQFQGLCMNGIVERWKRRFSSKGLV